MSDSLTKLDFVAQSIHLDRIESTNTYAKEHLDEIAPAGHTLTVIRTDIQNAGRGRQSRTFFSAVSGGLWISLIVPIGNIAKHFGVNRALSVALCETLNAQTADTSCAIKWPNDIYWRDKKICGMLLETAAGYQKHIVAGFGLNVNIARQSFPPSLQNTATSLHIETNKEYDLDRLLNDILNAFDVNRRADDGRIHRRYCALLYKTGSRIRIGGKEGIFDSVDTEGFLLLNTGNATERFASGTVEFI